MKVTTLTNADLNQANNPGPAVPSPGPAAPNGVMLNLPDFLPDSAAAHALSNDDLENPGEE